jgi:hypothetical protein
LEAGDEPADLRHTESNWKRLILGFGVLAAEPRGATIGPMSDGRSCLSSKAFGC